MLSELIVATVALTLASSPTVQAQCPCYPPEPEKPDIILCEDRTLTSIPDCVPDNITSIIIRTPTIPLVPETISRFTLLGRVIIEHMEENPVVSKDFLSNHPDIYEFQIYRTGLDYVDNDWFAYTPKIRTLILSFNNIKSVSVDTFRNLPRLSALFLNHNALTTLPLTIVEGTSLGNLYLHDNPWNCDCELASFIQWAKTTNIKGYDGVCLHPQELAGQSIRDLSPDLVCT